MKQKHNKIDVQFSTSKAGNDIRSTFLHLVILPQLGDSWKFYPAEDVRSLAFAFLSRNEKVQGERHDLLPFSHCSLKTPT